MSYFSLKHRKFRKLITFEPTVVLYNGKLIHNNIKRIHYSIDEVITILRENEIFDISRIEYGIVEANGKLSIINKPQYEKVTLQDLNLPFSISNATSTVIMDGKINSNNIKKLQLSEQEILEMIHQQGISHIENIFFATIDTNNNINISTYNETARDIYTNTYEK